MDKKPTLDKPNKLTPFNRKGFHTKNNTQDMSKGSPTERALATTIQTTPSGENGLPSLH